MCSFLWLKIFCFFITKRLAHISNIRAERSLSVQCRSSIVEGTGSRICMIENSCDTSPPLSPPNLSMSQCLLSLERCTTCCSTCSKEPDRRYQWLLVDELQLIYYSIILTFTALAPTTLLSWWRTWCSKFISQKYVEDNLEESGSPNFDQVPALDKVFAEREHLSI